MCSGAGQVITISESNIFIASVYSVLEGEIGMTPITPGTNTLWQELEEWVLDHMGMDANPNIPLTTRVTLDRPTDLCA